MIPLAFYGTLMVDPDGPRRGWMDLLGSPLRPCVIPGDLFSVHGSFPALVPGDGRVVGQLWEPFEETEDVALAQFDQIEGFHVRRPTASHYVRREVALLDPVGVTAWVYHYNYPTAGLEPIPSGDWRAYYASVDWGRVAG